MKSSNTNQCDMLKRRDKFKTDMSILKKPPRVQFNTHQGRIESINTEENDKDMQYKQDTASQHSSEKDEYFQFNNQGHNNYHAPGEDKPELGVHILHIGALPSQAAKPKHQI
jgi:hypothetical protein